MVVRVKSVLVSGVSITTVAGVVSSGLAVGVVEVVVLVGLGVGVRAISVGRGVGVAVGRIVGVGVGEGDFDGEADGEGDGEPDGEADGLAEGDGEAVTATVVGRSSQPAASKIAKTPNPPSHLGCRIWELPPCLPTMSAPRAGSCRIPPIFPARVRRQGPQGINPEGPSAS
jgi:hypothetical protein